MEPFEGTQFVVACDHVPVGHVVTEAEGRLMIAVLVLSLRLRLKHHLLSSLARQRHSARLSSAILRLLDRPKSPQKLRIQLIAHRLNQWRLNLLQLSSIHGVRWVG